MRRKVPVSLLKETVLTGTPEEVVDQAAEWRDHGVRYIVVCNISFLQPNLRRGLSANIPFIKVRRRLKRL
ncbi:MAG: flavin-dependent oxidoreductase, F420-dependent methylene-tetrahydromethanopterin reductase [Mycobacterium sp.]|nr:flavin-dependent oxidoreductase, F420-dependent methylene-tetrahydromethanopterin reductase [Mycobacterium sp.]